MTIRRQLTLILVILVSLSVLAGFLQSIHNQKEFVSEQIQIQAEDTAAALAVSLSWMLSHQQKAEIATLVNTVFDSGYYQRIVVRDVSGKPLYERKLEHEDLRVESPGWFQNLFKWSLTPVAQPIVAGWTRVGTVVVQPFDGIAAAHLWRLSIRNFWTLVFTLFVAVILSWFVARQWLRPLRRITHLAKEIQNGHFKTISPPPKTEELAILTNAINRMSLALSEQIEALDLRAKRWHEASVTDPVTQLPNRLAFHHELEATLTDNDLQYQLGLGIVRLDALAEVNAELGYQVGNDWLSLVSATLQKAFAHVEGARIFRLDGPEFTIIFRRPEPVEIEAIWIRTLAECRRLSLAFSQQAGVHGGLAWLAGDISSSKALTLANEALQKARVRDSGVFIYNESECLLSAKKKSEIVEKALSDLLVQWWRQPVRMANGAIEYELFSRWMTELGEISTGELTSTSGFIELDMARRLDFKLLEEARCLDMKGPSALNINLELYQDEDTLWQLIGYFEQPERWRLESSRLWLTSLPEKIGQCVRKLQQHGIRVGIEHFSFEPKAAEWLSLVKPDYIKVNVRIAQLQGRDTKETLLHWLKPLCRALSIDIILTGIETEKDLHWAEQQNVDGYQGFIIGQPHLVDKA